VGRGRRLRTGLSAIALIVAAAVVLGLLQNSVSGEPLSLTGVTESSAATASLATPQDVRDALAQEHAVLVDSRETAQYEAGHLKGALSVPFPERERRYEELLQSVPSATRIVVYCDQGCDTASRLASWLRTKGWPHVSVFESGFSAWRGAGLPVSTGAEP